MLSIIADREQYVCTICAIPIPVHKMTKVKSFFAKDSILMNPNEV